jgi:6-pyruvoyltetrahydropterin/6-carboxytetrahydropterin synthase
VHVVERYHDISTGHRVHGHESKCAHLHGHNYRIHFRVTTNPGTGNWLDKVGRVIDFSVIKTTLCEWLEDSWDHKLLLWINDPMAHQLKLLDPHVVIVPFNPTAENMAEYLVERIGPRLLQNTGVYLHEVTIEETRKCSVTYTRPDR